MQVRHDEGVAIRIDPEPCAVVCKGDSEASVGECIGEPLSLVKIHILGADAIAKAEEAEVATRSREVVHGVKSIPADL